jgi:NADPH:quinone reductase-like Zn-dependent oxidoreductase
MTTPNLPAMMKAAVLDRAGPPEAFQLRSVPVPQLAPGQVVVALDYASVGIWDAKQRTGEWGAVKPGTILGSDGSGTVVAIAPDVTRLRLGDRVYSYSYESGFYAEFISVAADRVARVPEHVSQQIAGAMPCVALTAHAGLHALAMKRGQTLLVFGATGGVGSFAVWLAAHENQLRVLGTARQDAQGYLRALGGEPAVDASAGFDAVLATANAAALAPYFARAKANAPVAYPNGVGPEPAFDGHPAVPFDGPMSAAAFDALNAAIGARTIPLQVEELPFDQIVEAHRRIDRGHVQGKIVLRIR